MLCCLARWPCHQTNIHQGRVFPCLCRCAWGIIAIRNLLYFRLRSSTKRLMWRDFLTLTCDYSDCNMAQMWLLCENSLQEQEPTGGCMLYQTTLLTPVWYGVVMVNMEQPGFLQHSIKCCEPSVQWNLFVLSQSAQHSRAGTALSPSPQRPLSSFQRLKYCVEGRAGLRSLVRANFSLEEGPSAVVLVMSWESRATPTNACTNSQNWAKLNLVLLDQCSLVLNDSAQMSVCVCVCCGIRRVCVYVRKWHRQFAV